MVGLLLTFSGYTDVGFCLTGSSELIFVFSGVFPASGSSVMWWLWPKLWRWKPTVWFLRPAALIFVRCLQVLFLTPDTVLVLNGPLQTQRLLVVSPAGAVAEAVGTACGERVSLREVVQLGLQFATLDGWCWSSLTISLRHGIWVWGGCTGVGWVGSIWVTGRLLWGLAHCFLGCFFFSPLNKTLGHENTLTSSMCAVP